MFRTDLLSIIRSLNTVFTANGICRTSYGTVHPDLASRQSTHDKYLSLWIQCWDSWWWTV